MSNVEQLTDWLERYVQAWNTNDPAQIGALWSADAVYRTSPFADEWRGRDQIIERWLERQDEPNSTSFRYAMIGFNAGGAVVRGWTTYHTNPPREYSNIWLIQLDDSGRCSEFTEWWMQRPTA